MSGLDEQIASYRNELQCYPQGHLDHASSLNNLAVVLSTRFERFGRVSDLDKALTLNRSALELRPEGHPDRSSSLNNLGSVLYTRFGQFGRVSDLDEALALHRSALELRQEGHPERGSSLNNLANVLSTRFKQLGRMSDLDKALVLYHSALELHPEGDPHRGSSLDNLANVLSTRFNQLGRMSDLDEALILYRSALELHPEGHPRRGPSLDNLANALSTRFQQLGRVSDLDEALVLYRSALELYPEGHPGRGSPLNNLANVLSTRFEQLGRVSDLDEAFAFHRSALELRPEGHPDRGSSLNNLANDLYTRFNQFGRVSDLDEALILHRSALELRPEGHPDRGSSLNNLANVLSTRFNQLGEVSDLDEALVHYRSALELHPEGHPYRGSSLNNLAKVLYTHSSRSTLHDDLQDTFSLYTKLADIPPSQLVSFTDVYFAKEWIQKAEECKHDTMVLAYQTCLRLSIQHITALPSLPNVLKLLKRIISTLPADVFSACLRCGNLTGAIELLEQGRGVFWNQLVGLRSPLDDVVASGDVGKKFPDDFMQVVSSLRSVFDGPQDAQHDRASTLNIQLQSIIDKIRELSGLSRFLHPPLFSDLQVAASDGPVIIVNASEYSCDAVLLLSDRDPVHIPLPITKGGVLELSLKLQDMTSLAKSVDVTRGIRATLRRLWDSVIFPIVEVLQNFCPRQSRIWWCPTTEFSLLPLHAAGPFRTGQPILSDLYISSYTPTLTALIRARKETLGVDPLVGRHRFLFVGQAQAPGQNSLPSVGSELSTLSERFASVGRATCVQAQDANIGRVGAELNNHNFVHFACHGVPDQRQPFKSVFALSDRLFEIEQMMRYDLQDAKFAYLPACHTTVGDEESPDEVIHLAAAMQFAGFPSVIGTMWAVDDEHTNEITSRFYENMVDESGRPDHMQAAAALHKTIRSLHSSNIPFDQQILYVHIGA